MTHSALPSSDILLSNTKLVCIALVERTTLTIGMFTTYRPSKRVDYWSVPTRELFEAATPCYRTLVFVPRLMDWIEAF
jgi:hypothetical protein